MADTDYRELQLSSSQLVLIFVAIIILGVIIFLLGVSVGKKQAQISETTQIAEEPIAERVEKEIPKPVEEAAVKPKPAEEEKTAIKQELATHEKKRREEPKTKAEPAIRRNLYYIQVGAYKNRESAYSVGDRLKGEGFPILVREPSSSDRRGLYRVWVGGFETREQADARMADLAKVEGKRKADYFIVKH